MYLHYEFKVLTDLDSNKGGKYETNIEFESSWVWKIQSC